MTTNTEMYFMIDNFNKLYDVFKTLVMQQHNVSITPESEPRIKKMLYFTMQEVKSRAHPDSTLKELNVIALQAIHEKYLETNDVPNDQPKKANVQTLDREQELYGKRLVNSEQLRAENTSFFNPPQTTYQSTFLNRDNRDEQRNKVPFVPMTEGPLSQEEMLNKVKDYEDKRLNVSVGINMLKTSNQADPTEILRTFEKDITYISNSTPSYYNPIQSQSQSQTPQLGPASTSSHMDLNVKPSTGQKEQTFAINTRYMLLNGFDRKWDAYPYRFQFTLATDSFQQPFKNITEISFTRLVIPLETPRKGMQSNTPDSLDTLGAPLYYNKYGLTFPYLILSIDEFGDTYEGLHNATRKCSTLFVYNTAYTAENGRGYIIMEPVQKESKVFYPNFLPQLPKLSIAITRPNGMLYNMSRDENSAVSFSYLPIDTNKLYLRVQTSRYFDKNEINVGDVILFKNVQLPLLIEFLDRIQTEHGISPTDNDIERYTKGIAHVERFLNRVEGHEVQGLGALSTSNALAKEFAIFVPRILNTIRGEYEVDLDFVNTIMGYQGQTINNAQNSYFDQLVLASPAPFLNMSLQVTLTATIKMMKLDSRSIIDPLITIAS